MRAWRIGISSARRVSSWARRMPSASAGRFDGSHGPSSDRPATRRAALPVAASSAIGVVDRGIGASCQIASAPGALRLLRPLPLPRLLGDVDRCARLQHRDVDGDGGAELLRRRHHREGVVGCDRRRGRLPPVGRHRADRFGDVRPAAPRSRADRDELPVGDHRCGAGHPGEHRPGDARRSSPSWRWPPAASARSASPRSRTRCRGSSPASTSSPRWACPTRSGTSGASSGRRWPGWRSPSAGSARRCGATRSASSP